jgi:hypothetical protein
MIRHHPGFNSILENHLLFLKKMAAIRHFRGGKKQVKPIPVGY